MIRTDKSFNDFNWVETEALTDEERTALAEQYGLTEEMITYVTDKDESPHYVYDDDTDNELITLHVPYILDQTKLKYITRPVSFLMHSGNLFTFNESRLEEVNTIFQQVGRDSTTKRADLFILEAMFAMMDSYIPVMRLITRQRNQMDKVLSKNAKNKDLIALSYLRQTLTFFSSAVQLNLDLLNKLGSTHFGKTGDDDRMDGIEDVHIESEQVQRMIEIETQVVERISDTFNSVVNNNLNDIMEILTIWSLTMAVPTILTGFYGMNVHLPFEKWANAWVFIIILSAVFIIWLLMILKFHRRK
ncbi:Mg2 transporter protein CorA family protein [Secundilactobacillus oryzae JCM 18671]|uniref:Mg2 transporter protein CorA family protein n=1 Tax=Secundilactobacillus oryzae JCM 18671 TaxID=1291743 RepID=A0A081BG61_9LACO|nr:magnesium transporter CorA family protein [Secundilactobacillus oryzae]GAK47029.1 Mg2 transporter protein CorA family protein [Secundilactobacillus oryzae JCM 18671]